ncbi:hypothetical protein [Loigolactobacillus bifermentans]|nr:hypothetical protein [Loigolactobacillus bifermentans]
MKGSSYKWLNEYMQLENDISYLEWEIQKTTAESDRWLSGDLGQMHVGGDHSRPAQLNKELDKLTAELQWRKRAVTDLKELIQKFKGTEAQILRKKYVEGETLEDIATDLNYSVSYIRQKHAELHRRLDFIDNYIGAGAE